MIDVVHAELKWTVFLPWEQKPTYGERTWIRYRACHKWWPDEYRHRGSIALCEKRLERLTKEGFLQNANALASQMLVLAAKAARDGREEDAERMMNNYNETMEWIDGYDGE